MNKMAWGFVNQRTVEDGGHEEAVEVIGPDEALGLTLVLALFGGGLSSPVAAAESAFLRLELEDEGMAAAGPPLLLASRSLASLAGERVGFIEGDVEVSVRASSLLSSAVVEGRWMESCASHWRGAGPNLPFSSSPPRAPRMRPADGEQKRECLLLRLVVKSPASRRQRKSERGGTPRCLSVTALLLLMVHSAPGWRAEP